MSIGQWLFGLFDGMGPEWVVLCIALLFFLDALLVPTLPELFFVLGYSSNASISFGCELLLGAVVGELAGIFLLYYIVSRVRVPKRIAKIADKYVNFLIVSDERALLMNRVAPMIPFAGAFIALIDRWNVRKCVFYIVLGCVLKYGVIMLASDFFLSYFEGDMAQTVMLVFIFAIIIISFVASYFKKRKAGLED